MLLYITMKNLHSRLGIDLVKSVILSGYGFGVVCACDFV
jgi:hypothetical protein